MRSVNHDHQPKKEKKKIKFMSIKLKGLTETIYQYVSWVQLFAVLYLSTFFFFFVILEWLFDHTESLSNNQL